MSFEDEEQENNEKQKRGSRGSINNRVGDAQQKLEKGSKRLNKSADKLSNQSAQAAEKAAQNVGTKAGKKAGKEAATKALKSKSRKKLAETFAKGAAKLGKFSSVMAKLLPIISTIGLIIIVIIAIIGVIAFAFLGAGLIMSALKDISSSIASAIMYFFEDSAGKIRDSDLIDVANQIKGLGYDLYGYGFVNKPDAFLDNDGDEKYDEVAYIEDASIAGFFNYLFDTKTEADDEIYRNLLAYLYADNYAYIVKNNNRSLGERFGDLFNSNKPSGVGLISLWNQKKGEIGVADGKYSVGERGYIKADPERKELIIKRGWINSAKFRYSLNGWTGRYSMPLEFLLSVHIATGAPDLAYKLATSFDTDVQILLKSVGSADVKAGVHFEDSNSISKPDESVQSDSNNEIDLDFDSFKRVLDKRHTFNTTEWWAEANFNSEDAKNIMKKYGIKSIEDDESPYNCLGPAEDSDEHSGDGTGMRPIYLYHADSAKDLVEAQTKYEQSESGIGKWGISLENEIVRKEIKVYLKAKIKSLLLNDDKNVTSEFKEILNKLLEENPSLLNEKIEEFFDSKNYKSYIKLYKPYNYPIEDYSFYTMNTGDNTKGNLQVRYYNKDSETLITTDSNGFFYYFGMVLPYQVDEDTIKYLEFQINFCLYIGEKNGDIEETTPLKAVVLGYSLNHSNVLTGLDNTTCSKAIKNGKKIKGVCTHCEKYISDMFSMLRLTKEEDVETYYPYINRVTDHWFRNVYFTGKGRIKKDDDSRDSIIQVDNYYEQTTGERWTSYEMHEDSEHNETDYEVYTYFPEGEYDYQSTFEKYDDGEVVVVKEKGSQQYSREEGTNYYKKDSKGEYTLKVVKGETGEKTYSSYTGTWPEKFKTGKKAVIQAKSSSGSAWANWSAYEFDKNVSNEWKELEIDEDTPDEITNLNNVKVGIKYQVKMSSGVKQVEDGVRGETNSKIKKIFLDDYYLYDGTSDTADMINEAKSRAKIMRKELVESGRLMQFMLYDYNNPDNYREFLKKHPGNHTYINSETGKIKNIDIDAISGPISLTHGALSAFNILRNMHTLDAEYIYHDFKELIVELDYFDKEELSESEDDVMMFPISGVSSLGWPNYKVDKLEDTYGTLIHSSEDYEAKKAEQISQIMNFLKEEKPDGGDSEEVESTSTAPTATDTTTSTTSSTTPKVSTGNPLVDAAADIASILVVDGEYCQGTGDNETGSNNAYPSWHTSHHQRAKSLAQLEEQHSTDCSGFVSICLQQVGILGEGEVTNSQGFKNILGDSANIVNPSSIDELKPGMLCVYPGHVNIYAGDGKFYDWGSKKTSLPCSYSVPNYAIEITAKMTYNGITLENAPVNQAAAEFGGYSGEEVVVAPATGEVLKYGTVKRKNVETGENEVVGFAKIRLLGTTEVNTNLKDGCTKFGGTHVSASDANRLDGKKEKDPAKWIEENYSDETARKQLGYDYFWQEYANAGINDCVIYIEGFDVSKILGDIGDTTTKDPKNIQTLYSYIDSNESLCSYKTDYVLPSILDKNNLYELKIAEEAKKEAVNALEISGKIYIKEGAVLGYTYTKDKINTKVVTIDTKDEAGNIVSKDYNVGNYMRVIFRDVYDEVIENVEDYMEVEKANPITAAPAPEGVFEHYIDCYENGTVWEYLYGDIPYSEYLAQFITEDKSKFICYSDNKGKDDRNYGFGIKHYDSGYCLVEEYNNVGVNIADGSHIAIGTSKCAVDKVIAVQRAELENKRATVIRVLGESVYNNLTPQQQDCLTDITYQGCGTLGDLRELLEDGATPQDIVDKWPRLTDTTYNNPERAAARKKLWLEGVYQDEAGNQLN